MFKHVCPRTGHVRVFKNGRAAKRWVREQEEKFTPEQVPTLFCPTSNMGAARSVTRSRTGNPKLGKVKDRHNTFSQPVGNAGHPGCTYAGRMAETTTLNSKRAAWADKRRRDALDSFGDD